MSGESAECGGCCVMCVGEFRVRPCCCSALMLPVIYALHRVDSDPCAQVQELPCASVRSGVKPIDHQPINQ